MEYAFVFTAFGVGMTLSPDVVVHDEQIREKVPNGMSLLNTCTQRLILRKSKAKQTLVRQN